MASYFPTGYFRDNYFAGIFVRVIGGAPATRPFLRGLIEADAAVPAVSSPARVPAPARSGPSLVAVRSTDPSVAAKDRIV